MSTALLFTGQGAQVIGMGQALYDDPKFQRHLDLTDAILDYPLSQLIQEGPQDLLNQTQYAQVALFCVGVGYYNATTWSDLLCMAGHSLGEYIALACSGVFSYEEGLQLVAKRGRLMQAACEATQGKMAAILRAKTDEIKALLLNYPDIVLANHNASDQIVLSGHYEALDKCALEIKEKKLGKAVMLKVSGAFHSPLMESADRPLKEAIEAIDFKTPHLPMIGNTDGKVSQDRTEIKEKLKAQLLSPVRWLDTQNTLSQMDPAQVIELGPKKVLLPMLKKTCPNLKGDSIDNYLASK